MIYYAVVYMKDGQIHLMPHATKEAAEECLKDLMGTKWGPKVDFTRVVKKDPDKDWYRSVNGHWI